MSKLFQVLRFNILTVLSIFLIFAVSVSAQPPRDHLTDNEIELLRDIQELDTRMEVYVKAIDRRLMVINKDTSQSKQIEKDSEKWGELPKGSRLELLSDIKKILQEAIDKIDDVAARDEKSELLPYAVHVLSDGVNRFIPELQKFHETATDKREIGVLMDSLEFSSQITEAASKIAKPTKKRKKN